MFSFIMLDVPDDPRLSDSFEEFVNKYNRLMMSAAMNVLNNYHDAEEAVMDALVSIANVYSEVSTFEDDVKRAYACRSARNRALNILNARIRRERHEIPIDEADESELADTREPGLFNDNEAGELSECLKLLPMKYRDVLYMYYAEELTAAKISEILGINKKTVQTRLLRGRKELKRLLAKEGTL